MVDMTKIHYHVSQRCNEGPPHAVRTDRDAAAPHMALDDLRAILPRLGYTLLDAEITAHSQRLIFSDPFGDVWTFSMWACACMTGENEIRAMHNAVVLVLPDISPN